MDQLVDWTAFRRLDNAAVVDFLTSTAGALAEGGQLGLKETDNLRLVLSGVMPDAGDKPILLELARQNAEFLAALEARWGTVGYCLNLMRHTLRTQLVETRQTLAQLGEGLLKKAELLFNRPLEVVLGGSGQKQVLYSTFLVDFSEALAESCSGIDTAIVELNRMNPHAMAAPTDEDRAVDEAVARALGFKDMVRHSLPGATELALKRQIAAALEAAADAARAVAKQLAANAGHGYGITVACEWLTAEGRRLASMELPDSDNLVDWEVKRRSLITAVASANEALKLMSGAMLDALQADQGEPATTSTPVGLAAKRRVVAQLIKQGTAPTKAWVATEALATYLTEHKVSPRAVLAGELTKIHAALTPSALEALARLDEGQGLMTYASAEKTQTTLRARRLGETFKGVLLTVALIASAGTFLGGCGLKTKPVSDVVDFRPDLPFRPGTSPLLMDKKGH